MGKKCFQKSITLMLFLVLCIPQFIKAADSDGWVVNVETATRGFQTPVLDTNFPSQTLFSIADIGRTTKRILNSSSWKMTRSADYQIETEKTGSPMIRVESSTVLLDFNSFRINKVDQDQHGVYLDFAVGLEVGYSPAQLAADPTLKQPQNVVIQNGVLSNFQVGILVHKGVRNVTIKNMSLSRCPVGIVFLGTQDDEITSCSVENVRIIGDNTDNQIGLKWAKAKIEQTGEGDPLSFYVGSDSRNAVGMGYGNDYFMPEFENPTLESASPANQTALRYTGLYLKYTANMLISNVAMNTLGYNGVAHQEVAENDVTRDDAGVSKVPITGIEIADTPANAVTQGLVILNSDSVNVENSESSNLVSGIATTGAYVANSSSCTFKNSVFSNNEVTKLAGARETYDFVTDLGVYRSAIVTAGGVLETARDEEGALIAVINEGSYIVGFATTARDSRLVPVSAVQIMGEEIVKAQTARTDAGVAAGGSPGALDQAILDAADEVITEMQALKTAVEAEVSGAVTTTIEAMKAALLEKIPNSTVRANALDTVTQATSASVQTVSGDITPYLNAINTNITGAITQAATEISSVDQDVLDKMDDLSTAIDAFDADRSNANQAASATERADLVTAKDAVGVTAGVKTDAEDFLTVFDTIATEVTNAKSAINTVRGTVYTNYQTADAAKDGGGADAPIMSAFEALVDLATGTASGSLVTYAGDLSNANASLVTTHRNALNALVGSGSNGTVNTAITNAVTAIDSISLVALDTAISNAQTSATNETTSALSHARNDADHEMILKMIDVRDAVADYQSNIGLGNAALLASIPTLEAVIHSSGVVAAAEEVYKEGAGAIDLVQNCIDALSTVATAVFEIGEQVTAVTTAHTNAVAAGGASPNTADTALIAAINNVRSSIVTFDSSLRTAISSEDVTTLNAKITALQTANSDVGVTAGVKTQAQNVVGPTVDLIVQVLALTADPLHTAAVVAAKTVAAQTARDLAETAAYLNLTSVSVADQAILDAMDGVIAAFQNYENALRNTVGDGLSSKGMYLESCDAVLCENVTCNRNKAYNTVKGIEINAGNVIELINTTCDHNEATADNAGSVDGLHFYAVNTSVLKGLSANYNLGTALVHGMRLDTVVAVDLDDISCSNNYTATSADDNSITRGLYVVDVESLDIKDMSCNYNRGEGSTRGIYLSTASAGEVADVFANNNQSSAAECVGFHIATGSAIALKNVSASYNLGKTTSKGMYCTSPSALVLSGVTADHNRLIDTSGTEVVGLDLNLPTSCVMDNISASDNNGQILGIGIRVNGGSTVAMTSATASLNTANAFGQNETLQEADASNASKHLRYDMPSGAVGVYIVSSKDCLFKDITASKNTGPRAVGLYVRGAKDSSFTDCVTSFQEASGQFFMDNPFNVVASPDDHGQPSTQYIDFSRMAIPGDQADTLFGGLDAGGTIDLKVATTTFLTAVKNLKEAQWLLELTPNYTTNKDFVSSQLLIRAAMARFRMFSTAVGVHLHDCSNCIIENHFASGNVSEKDSAFGMACTGTGRGHLVKGGKFAGQEAWSESAKTEGGEYNMIAIKPFWDRVEDASGSNFDYTALDGTYFPDRYTTKTVGLNTVPYYEVKIDSGVVGDPQDYELVNPVGGIAAGILLGDAVENVEVINCDCSNNEAHCGQAYALLQDVTSAATIQDNRLYQSSANLLGVGFGLAEMTSQSNTIHTGNLMFGNRVGTYLNSNYLIPFNPNDPFDLSFPLKTGYNGDIGNFANASPYDNLEIRFVHPAPGNLSIPDNIALVYGAGTAEWEVDRGNGVKMYDAPAA